MSALNGTSSHLFSQTKEQLMSPDVYYNIQNDDDLLASQPAKPNVCSFTLPLLGRFQVISLFNFTKYINSLEGVINCIVRKFFGRFCKNECCKTNCTAFLISSE